MTFSMPKVPRSAPYSGPLKGGLFIDVGTADHGYVTAGYIGKKPDYKRLKFQVKKGSEVYNYDLYTDSKPMQFPVNMGNGSYLFRIMEWVEGNQYAQIRAASREVKLVNRFVPFTIPTVFCNYSTDGPCVKLARILCKDCATELDAVNLVASWVSTHVAYDYQKARSLSGKSGYIPSPDATFKECKGICFDFASMSAAMLRSLDIPCKVVTGYINDTLYHSWILAYADGKWRRRDPTLMSAAKRASLSTYTYKNRFIY